MIDLGTQDRHDLYRWLICGVVVLLAHGGFAAAVVQWHEPVEADDPSGAIVINLAPMPVAPTEIPTEIPPGPEQVEAQATPQTQVEETHELQPELPPAPDPEVVLAQVPPKQETPPHDSQPSPAPATTAPQVLQAAPGPIAAAPTQSVPTISNSTAIPSWKRQVVVMLERNKRYPAAARSRKEHGIVQISFALDRDGHVLSSRVVKSSGSATLDKESLDLLQRAQPFPPAPPELSGARISLTVPIRFNIRCTGNC
jgi:protein TonB